MNWSKLLPSTLNPDVLFRQLSNADHNIATQALRDIVIVLALSIAIMFAVCVMWQTLTSWFRTRQYLKVTRGGELAAEAVMTSGLTLFRELQHHLIEFPSRDGTGRSSKRRTVDAAEVFRESALGPAFSSSRLILAIPSILTGLGVLGTFVGLQLGIGSLDFNNLEASIKPLINSCAVAFSSSVWGVGASLLFSWWEKAWEGFALGRVRTIQNRVDGLFPRYVPEEALLEMERTSRGTEELLKGLAVAIGAEMQQASGSPAPCAGDHCAPARRFVARGGPFPHRGRVRVSVGSGAAGHSCSQCLLFPNCGRVCKNSSGHPTRWLFAHAASIPSLDHRSGNGPVPSSAAAPRPLGPLPPLCSGGPRA